MDPVHDRGSMDPVHESGPCTRSKSGGPWTPGPCFVLTQVTFIVDKKKNNKKRLPSFLHMFWKVQHLKGLMTVSDN